MNQKNIKIRLVGTRPLMMDRYAGDNVTQLPVKEKLYLDEMGCLILPAINLYSLLCAENTKSVCRQFFGKQGKTIGLGIASYTSIEPFEIPILGEGDRHLTLDDWGAVIREHKAVARVKGGIPNPKQRPLVSLPWAVEFDMTYQENKYCTLENLRQAIVMGGTLGLGTFRPFFGRYDVERFE